MTGDIETASFEDPLACVYQVNLNDRIVRVNQTWWRFARDNKVERLKPETVEGASIWGFISGAETRHVLEVLMLKARQGFGPITVPFRCDAPDRRRFMELTIRLTKDAMLEFVSRVVRQEDREPIPLLLDHTPKSEEFICSCSWCKRVEMPSGDWVEVEVAVVELDLFGTERLPAITHGMCPECSKKINAMFG